MQPTIFTLWVILSTIAGEPVILPVRNPEAWPIDQNMRQFLEHPERFFVPQAERLLCRQILDGDLAGVQASVADGASVDAIGRHGVTPLFWAYFARKYKIYQYLLEQGASPDVVVTLPYRDFRGDDVWRYCENDSVLMMTVRNQYIEDWLTLTLQYLKPRHWIQQHGNTDVLHTYVNCYSRPTGHSCETLAILIRLSLDLNEQTKDGSTALMLAVEQLNYSCAVQLVQAGAGLTCYDAYHRQLIHIMAGNYRHRLRHQREFPEVMGEWEASAEKRDWDRLMAALRQQGFSLTEALVDLEKQGDDLGRRGCLYQRRLQRDDAFCCHSGRELELDLREAE
jgi:ankyrin repeat protein